MALSGHAQTIASFLSSKGFSAAGIAGVLGTWQAESGLNPSITNSIGAHGFAQWLGSRRIALQALAHRMGSTENDPSVQLNFFWQELQQPQYAGLLHELQTTTNPQQAARDMVNIFERPGPGGDPGAAGFAATFFNGGLPGGGGNPGVGFGPVPGGPPGGGTPGGSPIPSPPGSKPGGETGAPWWVNTIPGIGPILGTNPQLWNGVSDGLGSIGESLGAMATMFGDLVNIITMLLRPSFWLRIGAFILGTVLLIGGFVTLKGAVL